MLTRPGQKPEHGSLALVARSLAAAWDYVIRVFDDLTVLTVAHRINVETPVGLGGRETVVVKDGYATADLIPASCGLQWHVRGEFLDYTV